MEGQRRVLGDDHPRTLNSINNMGLLLKSQGKFAEAEPYVREALEGNR
ncbi:MAG: tetratricopeptide repeat protein, partial [Planctomycetes bacterium]|nr:tetratricopeptide repeat protein [Planctomycetota bacterium]